MIPIIIADGCLYKCDFCSVKTKADYKKRSLDNIHTQIIKLKEFYSHDLNNHNSIFLAQNDALNAGIDLIEFSAKCSYDIMKLGESNLSGLNLFLFGSVDSLNDSGWNVFDRLENLPFKTYINIGFESADNETLKKLGKTVTAHQIEQSFIKMMEINRAYEKIDISANFVFGNDLPTNHLDSIFHLSEKHVDHPFGGGCLADVIGGIAGA
ncbi:MAG: radical SAM protein, partial [Promethearchaeota archaeon]